MHCTIGFAESLQYCGQVISVSIPTPIWFSERLVALIRRMHSGTKACFLVNGLLSEAIPARSGIRQGRPLAQLISLIVVELLGLTLKQDLTLTGLPIPERETVRHLFFAYVDNSTVFSERANHIARTFELIRHFGSL